MIAELILKVAGFNKGEVPYYPRPSNAGPERCLRALCYQAQGYRGRLLGDRFYAVMDDSLWHEELTLDFLRKSSFKVHSEQMDVECGETIHNGVPFIIRGKIDGLLTDLAGVDRLFEHKAINHFTFESYAQEGFPLDYLTQMAFYFVGLTKVQPDVKEGVLLIKNKNTSQYLEFFVDYDVASDVLRVLDVVKSDGTRRGGLKFTGLYGHAMDGFAEVERHRRENSLPPRQYNPGDWHCSYCAFSPMCDSSYEEEFSSFTEGANLSEIEEIVTEYVRLLDFKKRTEKTLDEKKDAIKEAMKAKECKLAKSNGYFVSLSLQKRHSIDKSLIPPEILKDVQRETLVEVLNVKPEKLNKKLQEEVENV